MNYTEKSWPQKQQRKWAVKCKRRIKHPGGHALCGELKNEGAGTDVCCTERTCPRLRRQRGTVLQTTVEQDTSNTVKYNKKSSRAAKCWRALTSFGGKATTRQIAEALGENVNGIAQTLGAMDTIVWTGEGSGGERVWKFKGDD